MSDQRITAMCWMTLACAGLLAACNQAPNARGGTTAAAAAGSQPASRGSRIRPADSVAPEPGDPNVPTLAKLDGMIVEWDEAQSSGQVDKAQALEQQLRYEVDANDPMLHGAARGQRGLAAQYLAVSALGFSSNPASTRVLVEVLRSGDVRLVGNALIALKLRADPETPLGPILRFIRRNAPTDARRYAPLALANILEARAAVGRPSEGGTTINAVTTLSSLTEDFDPVVRLHVARALGVIKTPETVPPLIHLVEGDHARVQWAAAAALARIGDPRGFPPVVRLLHETPDASKHLIRDVLVSYAQTMQQQPLTQGQLAQLGTGSRAWTQWFSEFKKNRGNEAAALGG